MLRTRRQGHLFTVARARPTGSATLTRYFSQHRIEDVPIIEDEGKIKNMGEIKAQVYTNSEHQSRRLDADPVSVRGSDRTDSKFPRSRSFERDRENVLRGLLLVAREAWLLTKTPATITTATKVMSTQIDILKRLSEDSMNKDMSPRPDHNKLEQKSKESENIDKISVKNQKEPFDVTAESLRSSTDSTFAPADHGSSKLQQQIPDYRLKVDEVKPLAIQPEMPSRKTFHEASVPSTPLSRAYGFGKLFTGLAVGTIAEATKRATGFSTPNGGSVWVSDANADRLASTLCRMRGAALKLGQMLSIQDEHVLPGPLGAALERVRAGADRMPDYQLNAVMEKELGRTDWESALFQSFDREPIAAASLGQVHSAILKDGRRVALKVQYPGVAESIESDVGNLRRIVRLTGIFPKGLFIDRILDVVGSELSDECDYKREAEHQKNFAELFKNDRAFKIPYVVDELSTSRILTMEYVSGLPLDRVESLPQVTRDRVGRMLLRLTLKELFEFGYVQSDPNFANYFFDPSTGQLILLDFGATKKYDDKFVDDYAQLVWAAAEGDRETLLRKSIDIGLLNGKESQSMFDAHVSAGIDIAEPFSRGMQNAPYDFSKSDVSARIAKYGPTFLRERLAPPPTEIYSLHRKLSGAFMACVRIKARFPCRDLLEEAVRNRLKRIKEAEQAKQRA